MQNEFQFFITKIIHGVGSSKKVGDIAKKLGARKALVMHGPNVKAAGIVDPCIEALKADGITDEELEKRRILGTEGFVSSFVVVDTEASEVVTGPKIFLNAVAEDESEFDKIRHQIVEQLQDAMMQGTKDTHRLQQIMRRTLGGWIARQLHRKPMIVPVVADIAQDIIEEPSK